MYVLIMASIKLTPGMILPYKGGDTASWLFATAQNNAHTTRTSIAVFKYGKTEQFQKN